MGGWTDARSIGVSMRYFRFIAWPASVALGLAALIGAHAALGQATGNFHEVIAGELYRSAQPSGEDIQAYASRYHIRTILNLRNEKRTGWYRDESAAAADRGITLIDFPMSSSKELPIEEAQKLAKIMADAPKPLLIHCEHGANRTGLASAIYVGAVKKMSESAAEFQLSPYYGNFAIKGLSRYAMYSSWDKYEETIGF